MYRAARTWNLPPQTVHFPGGDRCPDCKGHPDQSGDLLAIQLAQFQQVGQQRQGYLFSHAGNVAQQVVLLPPYRTPAYHLAQLDVQVVEFLFQLGDVGLDTVANFDEGAAQAVLFRDRHGHHLAAPEHSGQGLGFSVPQGVIDDN